MQRRVGISLTSDSRVLIRIFHVVLAIVAVSGLIASFPLALRAQPSTPSCGEGLIRKSDTGTGELLFKTSEPGCYFPAPLSPGHENPHFPAENKLIPGLETGLIFIAPRS